MSQNVKFFLNGTEFVPKDARDFAIKLDFTKSETTLLEVSTDRMRFELEAMDIVRNHLATLGPFEGIPLGIQIGGTMFDFYVDLSNQSSPALDAQTFIEASIRKRKGKDDFMRNAENTTFELLKRNGIILDSDILQTPYVIVKDDQPLTLIVLGISTYTIIKATIEQLRQTADAVAFLIKLVIPDFAGIVPVIKISEVVYYGLKVIFELAYTIALFLAIKNLIEQIVELVFPKIRYLGYMKIKRLLERVCQDQGYSFQSTVLDQYFGLSLLPAPRETRQAKWWQIDQSSLVQGFNKGYPTESDPTPTGGSLIKLISDMLNLEGRLIGNTFYMEDETYWQNQASLVVANNFNLQAENEDQVEIDTSQVFKRSSIVYARDVMDINTFDNIKGGAVEHQTDPVNVVNPDIVSITGSDLLRIPYSLATRKDELNFVEKIVNKIAQACDALTGSNLTSKVQNRIGVMQVSQQFFQNGKIMWIVGDRQPANYLDFISAQRIYLDRHVSLQVKNNMHRLKSNMPLQFTSSNLLQLLTNNYVPLETGEVVEFLTVDYIPERTQATVTYRYKTNDGFNTQTILVYED